MNIVDLENRVGQTFGSGDGARIEQFRIMEDGHAGLTYGFAVADANGERHYILKVAPPGVRRSGNTDVYRQAYLLRTLHRGGLSVPDVPFASDDDEELGSPYIVMERLPGRVFVPWEPHASFSRDPASLGSIWRQTAGLLAAIHRVDWQAMLPGWEQPRSLLEEIDRWRSLLCHADNPEWLAAGQALDAALRATLPDADPIGLIHGDYQPGNLLFENGEATGVIDWELASIGSQGLDVGWLLMMLDNRAWDASWRPLASISKQEMLDAYASAGGPALANLTWYQALAQYRLGSISCLNVKLHRTGKRRDAIWERFATSIPHLFSYGHDLLIGENLGDTP